MYPTFIFFEQNVNDEICALPYCFATCCGKSSPTFRDNLWCPIFSVLAFLAPEDYTDRLSRNVGKDLPQHAAKQPRRAQILYTLRQKPEITQNIHEFPVTNVTHMQRRI